MDKPKLVNKSYKKIVPLKGNLLAKFKNQIKKEISKNDNDVLSNSTNDATNNNVSANVVSIVKEPLKSPENRVIIQKVEHVKLEVINTNPKGPPRRLSSLFKSPVHPPIENVIEATAKTSIENDETQSKLSTETPNLVENQSTSSIKLLSTKIPDNSFNNVVPLKLVRTIKQPKPKPNLRNRFHRVETFKEADTKPVPEIDPIDYTSLVKYEVLVPAIEMDDGEVTTPQVMSYELRRIDPLEEPPVMKSVKDSTIGKQPGSDSEEDFRGFDNNSVFKNEVPKDVVDWFNLYKAAQDVTVNKPKEVQEIPFISQQHPEVQVALQYPPKVELTKSPKKSPVKEKVVKDVEIKSPVKSSSVSVAPNNVTPSLRSTKLNTEDIVLKTPQKKPQFNINQVMDPIASSTPYVPVLLSPKKAVESDVSIKQPYTAPQLTSITSPKASSSKELPEREHTTSVKSNKPEWMNDILAVIGEARIAEIDEMLKEIPNIVTGNAIETENVELRLIINHLLRQLKAKSVMETLKFNTTDIPKDSSDDDDDDDDDFPDSFDDRSNFFDPTTEDSVDASAFEDDTYRHTSDKADNLNESERADHPNESDSLATADDTTLFKCFSESSELDIPILRSVQSQDNVVSITNENCEMNSTVSERVRPTPDFVLVVETLEVQKSEIATQAEQTENEEKSLQKRESRKRRNDSPPSSIEVKKVKAPEVRVLLLNSNTRRRSPRSSSHGSSVDSSKSSDEKKTPKKQEPLTLLSGVKSRNSSCASLRSSSRESSDKLSAKTLNPRERKISTPKRLESDSDTSDFIHRSKRVRPLTDDSDNAQIIKSEDSDTPLAGIQKTRGRPKTKLDKRNGKIATKSKQPRKILNSSDSELATDDHETLRNIELKSRLNPDSNSNYKSSILVRNDYLKSPDKRKAKAEAEIESMAKKLSTTINNKKKKDSTFVTPPLIAKRQRLRTSAFKGNEECSNDEDIQNTDEPSVSRKSLVGKSDASKSQTSIKDRMKELIEKEKKKLVPNKFENSERPSSTRGRPRFVPETSVVEKKKIVQKPLEEAIERRVPYEAILNAIKVSIPASKAGRQAKNKEQDVKRERDFKALQALKYFRCGSCKFQVTKHKWLEHFFEHGGIAWIDDFEQPLVIDDGWNEALRRTINNFKIYNLISMKCPHCEVEKRSALGYLTHIFLCGENEEVVEKRKVICEMCNLKYLPYNASFHRKKCAGFLKVNDADDGDDEGGKSGSEHEQDEELSFNSSGRLKRKAVQVAEKKFKKIIETLNKPSDHLKIVDGQFKCEICNKADFKSESKAMEHIKTHDTSKAACDFDGSDASDFDASDNDESAEETEGSSGVNSSEIETSDDDVDNDDVVSSKKKGKPSATESQEVKKGRILLTEFLESLRHVDIPSKTIKWTKQFIDDNWKTEVFPQLIPKFTLTLAQDLKTTLVKLKFSLESLKFGNRNINEYESNYETQFKREWTQLEIGENQSDQHSATIYCGGSVSAVDWAPTSGKLNFLAVACNSSNRGIKMNLSQSIASCVQIFEFKSLTNEKFQGFSETSKLCYVIIIDDGPIWSIKFHPNESSIDNRIGLLAVSTANQSILVFSLPYLNNDKSIILPIHPVLTCRLEENDIFFNDQYLLQASRVAWFQKTDSDCFLAAGYINGLVAVWNISAHDYAENFAANTLFPHHVIQAHQEAVSAVDIKATSGNDFHLLTTSFDRKIKVFTFNEIRYQEISSHYSLSRIFCAQWWMNWPGFLVGFDDCFTFVTVFHRQPLEFSMRNAPLLNLNSSIMHININHWLNVMMFVTESGDLIGCCPSQMLSQSPNNRWSNLKFNVHTSTDFNKISDDEIGVVFCDLKAKSKTPKKFRFAPTDRINELQINQVCFNRNEKSYRFYALGYETGFVRVRYLKNSD